MSENNIPRLMIAIGDDSLAIESSLDDYLKMIRDARGQCVVDYFDSTGERIDDFLTRAVTASLFSEIRLFCVLHAQTLSEEELERLSKTLDYEIPDVYIYVSAEVEKKGDKREKIHSALLLKERKRSADKSITINEVSKPYDNKLAEWIEKRADTRFGRKIARVDAQIIADRVEYDLIDSELRKLDMILPVGASINKKAILEVVGATRTMTVYECAEFLGKRDLTGALNVLNSLFCGDFYAPLITSTVFKHFWSVLKIKMFLEKNPDVLRRYKTNKFGKDSPQSIAAFEIGKACGLLGEKDVKKTYPLIIKSGVVNHSQNFSSSGLRNILKMLQRFDVDVKTGGTDASLRNMQMLCYKIARTT